MARKKQNKTFLIILLLLLIVLVAFVFIKKYSPDTLSKIGDTYNLNFISNSIDGESNGNSENSDSLNAAAKDNNQDNKNGKTAETHDDTKKDAPTKTAQNNHAKQNKNKPAGWVAPVDNDPLLFGNPTGATNNIAKRNNYLLKKNTYTLSYNDALGIANWVAWHLELNDLGGTGRSNNFLPDNDLPDGFTKIVSSNYNYKVYGFDRGHLCPSADRTNNVNNNRETFLMTNIVPQSPRCNRKVWKGLEDFERELVNRGNELYIIAGTWGVGAKSEQGYFEYIKTKSGKNITVPKYCWKIILVLDKGNNDFTRANKDTVVICAFIDNSEDTPNYSQWQNYITNVDYIEEKTRYDFFAPLDDDIEDVIEKKKYNITIKLPKIHN